MAAMRVGRALLTLAIAAAVVSGAGWFLSGRGYGPARKRAFQQWVAARRPGSAVRGLLKAGVFRVDITPRTGVPLAGYGARRGRPSVGIHDRLHATALVISNGRRKIAVVSCDAISMSKRIRRGVLDRLGSRGFRNDNLLICATHSHSSSGGLAPEIIPQFFIGRFQPDLPGFMVERIAAAVEGADGAMVPARVGAGVVQVSQFIANRRSEDLTRPINPALTVLKVETATGEPLAVLCNYSAHATCIGPDNMQFSGDYPGYLQRAVEKALGGEAFCLFTIGTDADQSPRCPVAAEGFDRARVVGEGLARQALALLPQIECRREAALAAKVFNLRLPLTPMALMLATDTLVQAVAIEDFLILAVPGEMAAEIGARLVRRATDGMGFAHAAIFGIANDHVGYYILTPEQMRRGGYEAAVSFYGAQFGTLMEEAVASAAMAVRRMMPQPD